MRPQILSEEDRFRDDIISALIRDDETTAEDWHSPGEHGVDVLVRKKDLFGRFRWYGIQVKVGNLNAGDLETALGQAVIALGHEFPPEGKKLDGIYVVTNGSVTPTASEYVLSAEEGLRIVHFLGNKDISRFLEDAKREAKLSAEVKK